MTPEPQEVVTSESAEDIADANLDNSTHVVKDKEQKYVCSFAGCGERFRRQVKLDRHEYTHDGVRKHVCHFEGCTKSYKIIQHLTRHIKESHENMRPERHVNCLIKDCNKTFDFLCNMEKHLREVHEKNYPCPTCSSQFKRKLQLRKHLVTHTGKYPFKCNSCQQGFFYKALYQRHSCDPKEYKCNLCEKVFQKWTLLVTHKRSDHVISHKCDQCQKEFKRKEYLRKHLEKHKNAEDRDVVQCPWKDCTRYYYHAKNLRSHIRSKHEGIKYKCPFEECGKHLVSKQKLVLHVRLHEIQPELSKKKKPREVKKTRSDKGRKKKSYASTLAGIILKPDAEKLILDGQGKNIHVEATELTSDANVTDTDDEIAISKRVELVLQKSP